MVYRIYVEKKPAFRQEAESLRREAVELLGISALQDVRIVNRYDAENISEELFSYAVKTVFSEPQVDVASSELDLPGARVFAVEYLPGQFDQRADSAAQCIQLISQGERPLIRSARVYVLYGDLTEGEIAVYQGALLRFLAGEYARRDLAMQLHLGPIRNNSPKLLAAFGADAGGDSIGAATDPFLLSAFLSELEENDCLPKTILYNLNPADSAMLATMAVNFAADGAKVQYGAAWWLHDHLRGIFEQLDQLMETGLLSGSVGMLTDSRSFTSFARHEYFRRILCDKIGALVERGEYPDDMESLSALVEDICWRNAVNYFGF